MCWWHRSYLHLVCVCVCVCHVIATMRSVSKLSLSHIEITNSIKPSFPLPVSHSISSGKFLCVCMFSCTRLQCVIFSTNMYSSYIFLNLCVDVFHFHFRSPPWSSLCAQRTIEGDSAVPSPSRSIVTSNVTLVLLSGTNSLSPSITLLFGSKKIIYFALNNFLATVNK